MLSPEYLETIGEGGEEIAELLHHEIIRQIVERIAIRLDRGEDYVLTARDKWQIEVLQDAGYLREDIEKILAEYTGLMQKEIAEAMEAAGVKNMEWDDAVYRAAGLSPAPLTRSPYLIRLLQRAYEATVGEWRNYTRTTADAIQQTFVAACDKAYTLVSSGAVSYSQAFADAIKELADEGVAVVKYTKTDPVTDEERVHVDTIETATMRCIRTGISQATAAITDARMDEMQWDIILVSSHLGARVNEKEDFTNHFWWQGKFYSKSGKDTRFPPFSVCGFGHVQGIHGANCRHHKGPGDGRFNPFKEYDSEKNKKAYELLQKQRAMERRIRKTKQECVTLKSAVDNAGTEEGKLKAEAAYQKKAALLEKQNEAYNDFCKDNNLKRRSERLQIAKWNREQARESIKATENKSQIMENSPAIAVGSSKTDLEYINSEKYKNKFKSLSNNANLNQAVYKHAKAAVIHQSGSYNEDLSVISLEGKLIGSTSSRNPYETLYTKDLKQKIKENEPGSLIAIHNHGTNVPPSGADLVSAGEKKYAFGIVACHNGEVYYYSCKNAKPFLPELMDKTVDKYRRNPYNMDEVSAYKKALDQMAADYGVEWRELR